MPARKPLSDALETATPAANRIDRLLFNGAPFIKRKFIFPSVSRQELIRLQKQGFANHSYGWPSKMVRLSPPEYIPQQVFY